MAGFYFTKHTLGLQKGFQHLNYSDEEMLSGLSKLTHLDVSTLKLMTFSRFNNYLPNGISDTLSGKKGKTSFIRRNVSSMQVSPLILRNGRRICPHCIRETNSYLLPWNILIVTCCPIHQTLLIDCCPNCGTNFIGNKEECKKCGFKIKNMSSVSVQSDKWSFLLCSMIYSALGCSSSDLIPSSVPISSSSPLREITPIEFLKFVYRFLSLMLRYNPSSNAMNYENKKSGKWIGESNAIIHSSLIEIVESLAIWPEKFINIMHQIADGETKRTILAENKDRYPHIYFLTQFNMSFPEDDWPWLWKAIKEHLQYSPLGDQITNLFAIRFRNREVSSNVSDIGFTSLKSLSKIGIRSRIAKRIVQNDLGHIIISPIPASKKSKKVQTYIRIEDMQIFSQINVSFVQSASKVL